MDGKINADIAVVNAEGTKVFSTEKGTEYAMSSSCQAWNIEMVKKEYWGERRKTRLPVKTDRNENFLFSVIEYTDRTLEGGLYLINCYLISRVSLDPLCWCPCNELWPSLGGEKGKIASSLLEVSFEIQHIAD